jgi:hypothetical protein
MRSVLVIDNEGDLCFEPVSWDKCHSLSNIDPEDTHAEDRITRKGGGVY